MAYDPLERSGEIAIHGWLLTIAWGFLIPTGVLIWTHTKRNSLARPYLHILLGSVGTVLALAGFGYGVKNFSTFSRPNVSAFRKAHAYIGSIASIGAIIQVILVAFLDDTDGVTLLSLDAASIHQSTGWIFLVCGLVATMTGTYMASVTRPEYLELGLDHENEKFAGGLIGALLATGLVTATSVAIINKKCDAQAVAPETEKQGEEKNDIEGQQAIPPHQAFQQDL